MDDDMDGITDFPMEPGCETPSDDDETDPMTPAVCSNGVDDDMDGATDYPADNGCLGAGSDSEEAICGPGILVEDITATGMASGSTASAMNNFSPMGCATTSMAGEQVFMYRLGTTTNLTFSTDNTGTDYDTAIYVKRDDCLGMEIACNDDGLGGNVSLSSTITLNAAAPGVYFVFVDGYSTRTGNFVLTVTEGP